MDSRRVRSESLVADVLAEVAERNGCDALELPPLSDAVDPDALVALVAEPGVSEIAFSYDGYVVRIDGSGEFEIDAAR